MVVNAIYEDTITSLKEFNYEFAHFSKLVESTQILTEANIITEASWEGFKAKVKQIWESFKSTVKKIFGAIAEKFKQLFAKFKKEKVDKATKEAEEGFKEAAKKEEPEKIWKGALSEEIAETPVYYFAVKTTFDPMIQVISRNNLYEQLVTIKSLDNGQASFTSKQPEVENIKKHNEDVDNNIVNPLAKKVNDINDEIERFDASHLTKHVLHKNSKYGAIKKETHKLYKYYTPMALFKDILDEVPEEHYYEDRNPLNKEIETYDRFFNKVINGEVESQNISYLTSGLKYDISNFKKLVDIHSNIYTKAYNMIKYNMQLVYWMAERFNIYTGRLSDSEYKKLNNYDQYRD